MWEMMHWEIGTTPTTHPMLVVDDIHLPRATTLMYYCIGKHLSIAVLIIVSTQSA